MRSIPFLLLPFVSTALCQIILAQTPINPPAAYTNPTINFVRTWDATAPESNPNTLMTRTLRDVKQTTQYFDGLGRPLQTVVKNGSLITDPANPSSSANAKDMISAVVYDEFGREQFKYLPFASTATDATKNNGLFKSNPFQQQVAFYNTQLNGQTDETNVGPNSLNWAYSQTKFESSPLNRVQESFAPGNSWASTSAQALEANRRSVKAKYYINTTTDAVRIWNVTNGGIGVFGTYSTPAGTAGIYPAGQLYKNITVDEQGKQVIEFKDKEGKVILKKVQLTASADDDGTGKNHDGWLCTYYLYDDLNNLRCVIQPRGVELIASNWALTDAGILSNQCFRYEYDQRNRLIVKKVPGALQVDMIYDARDRMVMTQDGNLKATNRWLVTKYDGLNRAVETGLWTSTTTAATHRTNASNSTSYPATSGTYEMLTGTYYDNYDWVAANGNMFSTNRSTEHDGHFLTSSNTQWPYPQSLTQSFATTGLVTGTYTKVVGTANQYLWSISYYDDKGRVIQSQSYNITGWANTVQTQYDFSGKILRQIIGSPKNFSGTPRNDYVLSKFDYDDLGRLLSIKKTAFSYFNSTWINGIEKETVRNEYDALGQLKKKKLDPAFNNNAGLETLTYDYNVRGWLLGANRDYAKDANSDNYFGFDLGYDKANNNIINGQTYANPQYNGNIAGIVWKSKGDEEKRKYDFAYDAANRLLKADFTQYTGATFNTTAGVNFSVKMGDGISATTAYDANGNIKKMQQWGLTVGGSTQIDDLTYTYYTNDNRLQKVTDAITANYKLGDFNNGGSGTGTDYGYDGNGNMTRDVNKNIGTPSANAITYNHLNLPQLITVRAAFNSSTIKGTIAYIYDATGNKLKKITVENNASVPYNGTSYTSNIITTTLYIDGAVYESKDYTHASLSALDYADRLQFIGHEEGRIRWKQESNTFHYDYFLKDHLGNVRVVLTEEQQTDPYPAASMETAQTATEEALYSNLNTTRTDKPTGYPTDTYTNPNDKVARVKAAAGSQKIGPGIVLKVMAGDKFNIRANSWYKKNGATPGTPVNPLTDLLAALTGSVGSITSTHGGATAAELQSSGVLSPGATSFLNSQTVGAGKPKAYVNWVLFDEQFKYVSSNSRFEQVGNDQEFKTHTKTALPIDKSGYLYVYVSNETPNIDVFFDNLQVTHIRGPLLETNEYYQFGLLQKGISYRAAGIKENKEQTFQEQRFDDDLGLNWVQFKWRNHDPQIGRFVEIDPLAEEYEYNSTYAFSENKVTNHVELEGLEAVEAARIWQQAQQAAAQAGPYGKAIVVGGAIAAGIVWLGEMIHEGVKAGGSNNSMTLIPESMNRDMMKVYTKDETNTGADQTNNNSNVQQNTTEKTGRGKNHLDSDKSAEGDHSTIKRDDNGDVFSYQQWTKNDKNPNKFDPGKRFDGGKPDGSPGAPHKDKKTGQPIPTPHVNEPKGGVRPANPDEIPFNKRFRPTPTGN